MATVPRVPPEMLMVTGPLFPRIMSESADEGVNAAVELVYVNYS